MRKEARLKQTKDKVKSVEMKASEGNSSKTFGCRRKERTEVAAVD